MGRSNYTLYITPAAYGDLDQIYHYITSELYNEIAAMKLISKLEEGFLMLKEYPFSCSYVSDEALKKKKYRKVIIDNYIGLYIIDEYKKQVIIMRVLHGRQRYQDLI